MNRIAKAVGLSVIALMALTFPLAAQANVAGNWQIVVEGPEGPSYIDAVLAQEGEAVTGTFEVEQIGSAEISDGMVEENKLTFVLHVDFEGQFFTVEVSADIDGDAMTGEFYLAEFGAMPFTGKRTEG
jgi:hypothetical protein